MRIKFKYIISLLSLCFIIACEEVIEVTLPNPEPKLVVEGEINSGLPAIVNISYNMGYFDVIDSSALADMFIRDSSAIITVSDGFTSDTLQLMPITKFPFFAYVGTNILGEIGKSYTLEIDYKDKHYYATTSLPQPVEFSTIWFEPSRRNDSIGMIGYSFFDNGNENNYYASTAMTVGKQFWWYQPAFGSAIYDDIIFNGDSTIVNMPKGYDGNTFTSVGPESSEQWDSLFYYTNGDIVSLRLSTIDQDYYLWWNSLFRAGFNGSNPYSNPSTVITNINGDPALGVWGGYSNTFANVMVTDSFTIEELSIENILTLLVPDSILQAFN